MHIMRALPARAAAPYLVLGLSMAALGCGPAADDEPPSASPETTAAGPPPTPIMCRDGYQQVGGVCADVDECSTGLPCDPNATCINQPGSYQCECRPGFEGDGTDCAAAEGCAQAVCPDHAQCRDLQTGFECVCDTGYESDGQACIDIDECALGLHDCNPNSACENTPGSFRCGCEPGFAGNGPGCEDTDECALGTHDCDPNAACENTAGGYECTCEAGFTGDGTTCAPNYDIVLAYTSAPGPEERAAFAAAEARWEQLIIGDTTDVDLSDAPATRSTCGIPSRFENIDDILIEVNLGPIDGPGGILGSAGPRCLVSGLPFSGVMNFDSADIARMVSEGTLEAVILHEMGHVLGIGSLWERAGFVANPSCTGGRTASGADARYVGSDAVSAWQSLGGTGDIPLENIMGQGSCDSHWREDGALREELMSPVLSSINALSAITLRSLADIGYSVAPDTRADVFTVNGSSLVSPRNDHRPTVHLVNDTITGPIYELDPIHDHLTRIR